MFSLRCGHLTSDNEKSITRWNSFSSVIFHYFHNKINLYTVNDKGAYNRKETYNALIITIKCAVFCKTKKSFDKSTVAIFIT